MGHITENERQARQKGKKISVYTSRACEGVVNNFDIRLTDRDRFTAEYLGAWYEAATIQELKKALDEQVAKQGPTTWEYFIEIDDVEFEEDREYPHHWSSHRDRIEIKVDYRVLKLSNVIAPTGSELYRGGRRDEVEPYRLSKKVDVSEDGKLRDKDDGDKMSSSSARTGTTLLPYTPERWAALESISAAARELGRRMAQMLNGEKATAFLDSSARLSLLALPPAPSPEVVKPRKAAKR